MVGSRVLHPRVRRLGTLLVMAAIATALGGVAPAAAGGKPMPAATPSQRSAAAADRQVAAVLAANPGSRRISVTSVLLAPGVVMTVPGPVSAATGTLPSAARLAGPVRRRRPAPVPGRGLRRASWVVDRGPPAPAAMITCGGQLVSQAPAQPRVLILRAIDAAAADRHARLGHAGDWRAEGGCDCLAEVQPIVSAAGATFVQEYLRWLQTADSGRDGPVG